MEDKLFDLMSKMYSDLKNDIKNIGDKVDKVEKDLRAEIRTVGNQVIKLENELAPKVETALDGYKVIYEKLTRLEGKVDKQNGDIRVLKSIK